MGRLQPTTSLPTTRISPVQTSLQLRCGVRPAAMFGFQGLTMLAWVPAVFFLAALIDYSTGSLQEVHMARHTSTRWVSLLGCSFDRVGTHERRRECPADLTPRRVPAPA